MSEIKQIILTDSGTGLANMYLKYIKKQSVPHEMENKLIVVTVEELKYRDLSDSLLCYVGNPILARFDGFVELAKNNQGLKIIFFLDSPVKTYKDYWGLKDLPDSLVLVSMQYWKTKLIKEEMRVEALSSVEFIAQMMIEEICLIFNQTQQSIQS